MSPVRRIHWLLLSGLLLLPGCPAAQRQNVGFPRTLRLLTWNVWEKPYRLDARVPALLQEIQATDADIIALQEVTPAFLAILDGAAWVRAYHRVQEGEYVLLSRFPVEAAVRIPLPGHLKRESLVCRLSCEGRTLSVGVVHLESFLEDGPMRARQLDLILPRLAGTDDAVLLGDFNFGDHEPESSHLDPGYQDLWRSLYPSMEGFTWDIERSLLARKGSFPGESSRRLDRILVRSSIWKPESIRIEGATPLGPERNLWPSDHFGLCGSVTGVIRQ